MPANRLEPPIMFGTGFDCPFCGQGKTKVIDTRSLRTENGSSIIRARLCKRCNRNFKTRETIYNGPHRHKLTEDNVRRIRAIAKEFPQRTYTEIGKEFGVGYTTIGRIVRFERWPTALRGTGK